MSLVIDQNWGKIMFDNGKLSRLQLSALYLGASPTRSFTGPQSVLCWTILAAISARLMPLVVLNWSGNMGII